MFYYLNGELAYKDLSCCVIDCQGVGYKLTVSQLTSEALASSLGKRVKLFTHLSVREDGMDLFGFISEDERMAFNLLTSISGIGPKVAMGILSYMNAESLAVAILNEDVKGLAKAPGIGNKSASRIILELKDKISKEFGSVQGATLKTEAPVAPTKRSKSFTEAAEALAMLGYDKNTVLGALKDIDPSLDVGEIIRMALKKLAR